MFDVHVQRDDISRADMEKERQQFLPKGQACMRSSPLGKRYGWGIHSNTDSKLAIYAVESEEYRRLANDAGVKHLRAMRTRRA